MDVNLLDAITLGLGGSEQLSTTLRYAAGPLYAVEEVPAAAFWCA
jgi:hypothetical protein